MCAILQIWCQIQRTSSSLSCVIFGPGHIQCNYSSAYSGFNIRLNLSALLLEILGHVDARYTANLVANTAHILRLTLCVLWFRTYTTYIQLHIFRLQYSFERICAAIGNISTIQCSLYCKLGAKYSTHATSLRYVNCGPGHIQCIYSSSYSGHNIQLNVSALLLEIFLHFDARYTANLLSSTAHIVQFTLCELWSRTYTMHLQLHIFRLQYSFERICAAIGNISTIQCSLYCKFGAKYRAHLPVYAV
jgi:hypothetical protein